MALSPGKNGPRGATVSETFLLALEIMLKTSGFFTFLRGAREAPKRPSRGLQEAPKTRGFQEAPKRPPRGPSPQYFTNVSRGLLFFYMFWRMSRAFLVLLLKPSKPRETFAKKIKPTEKPTNSSPSEPAKALASIQQKR